MGERAENFSMCKEARIGFSETENIAGFMENSRLYFSHSEIIAYLIRTEG